MRRLGIIVAAIIFGVAAWWTAGPPYVYRYRLTVEIATPDGLRSGSSVIEVRSSSHTWGLPETRGVRNALRGEAVFVDLGQGRNLIAVLGGGPTGTDDTTMPRMPVIAFELEKLSWEEQQAALMGRLTGKRAQVPNHALPAFVTVFDVNDPKTARVVDPLNLQGDFGTGVTFNGAWVEITKDKVTWGLQRRLPLLVSSRDWMRHQLSYPDKFTPHFHIFVRE